LLKKHANLDCPAVDNIAQKICKSWLHRRGIQLG